MIYVILLHILQEDHHFKEKSLQYFLIIKNLNILKTKFFQSQSFLHCLYCDILTMTMIK